MARRPLVTQLFDPDRRGRYPALRAIENDKRFTGSLHDTHAPAARWRRSRFHPWRCMACHPPARPELAVYVEEPS